MSNRNNRIGWSLLAIAVLFITHALGYTVSADEMTIGGDMMAGGIMLAGVGDIADISTLRGRRSALAQEIRNILENSDKNDKRWEASDQEKYDAKMNEIDDIDKQIANVQRFLNKVSEEFVNNGGISDDMRDKYTTTQGKHGADTKALRNYLVGGLNALTEEQMAGLRARRTPDIQNAMSTTTGSEGGYTVASEYYEQLTQALKLYGGIRELATVIQTGTGAQMNFPATDATAEEGEIVGQNAPVTGGDTTFSNIQLDVYKYSSKKIALPFELIQDSMFDIEGYINALLAMRIGRITAKHFLTGTGTNQPKGLVTAATSGKVGTTGQTATVTYDDLVDLQDSVDPLYQARPGCCFVMNQSSRKVIRKLKDSQNRPIFVPGYETGVPGGAPDMLLGSPIHLAQEMPAMAANAKSILFGDIKSYFVREVMDLTLFRMADSAFTLNGQVGFVAFNRQGGNLIDVGGSVKYYQNSAT
jgi:HK97 family phage major capsid protein